jgi:hypothetical protein
MNAPTRMLLWSEWRQRRTQFIIGMLWLTLGTVFCIVYHVASGLRSPVGSFFGTTWLFSVAMPIFVAMRTSLGELSDRTRPFHDGLPVSARTRAVVRLAGGWSTLVVPIVCGAIMLSVCLATGWLEQAEGRTAEHVANMVRLPDRPSMDAALAVATVWRVAVVAAASASMLYLLLSILGMTLRSESHLGFAGTAVAAIWFLGVGLATEDLMRLAWLGALVPQSLSIGYSYQTEHGTYHDPLFASQLVGPLSLNLVLQLGLAAVFVRRYGRRIVRRPVEDRRRSAPKVWRPWAMPLPTRGMALAWLTLRQSVPMCIPGLVIATIMTPLQMDVAQFDQDTSIVQRMTDILPSSMWVVGLLWSIVIGAGIFAPELDSRIAEFWRAWPTGTSRIFGVKFVIGLAAVLLVLDGTTIAVSWNSPNWGHYYFMNWPYIACIVPLHATMFAIAVALTCLVRRPVVGGMLAFATFALTMIVTDWSNVTRQFNPIEVYNKLNQENMAMNGAPSSIDFTAHNYPAVAAMMATLIVTMALAGWWALRSYAPRRAVV